MSMFSSRSGLALVLAALCLGGRTADAQSAPVTYLIPGWSVGFGGNPIAGGSLPGFDGSDARGRYNFSNGWFVGGEGGGTGLSMNGINQAGAFGDPRSLSYQGVQFGYNFQNVGRPLSVYAGFDTLKYNPGIGGPFAPFDTTSGTVPGYSAHAGVEFQPTSNVSLSLGFGYTQQSGRIDSDFNSLPGVSPFAPRR
jgi:opacity protein-like surface antigen